MPKCPARLFLFCFPALASLLENTESALTQAKLTPQQDSGHHVLGSALTLVLSAQPPANGSAPVGAHTEHEALHASDSGILGVGSMTCWARRRGRAPYEPQASKPQGKLSSVTHTAKKKALAWPAWAACHSTFCRDVSLINRETVERLTTKATTDGSF